MSLSTNLISGLSSGFDWRTMIDQLISVERNRVTLVENQKTEYEDQLSEWQDFNSMLLSLQTSVESLQDADSFKQFTPRMTSDNVNVDGKDLLSVSTDTDAALGSYTVRITQLAASQKLSSNPFTSRTDELGSAYPGDIIINGKTVNINATDSLSDVANRINAANSGTSPSGVTASIINYGVNDYRLILTSDQTGAEGISLLNGGSADLVQQFGWKDNQTATVKNAITNGAQSDRFKSPAVAVKSYLDLSTGEASTGGLSIGGSAVTIDLSGMSLNDIKDAINDAAIGGVSAAVISEIENGTTFYRLQIDGSQTFVDENNILNTLGILDNASGDVSGAVSANTMTTDGADMTADTLLTDIDGFNTFTAGDYLSLSGTDTSGGTVGTIQLDISDSSTIQDILDVIEAQFGDVVAYVTSDGTLQVDDLTGGSSLDLTIGATIQDANSRLDFGTFSTADTRKREVVAGGDATVEIDGVAVTSDTNHIDNVIPGVTLDLQGENLDTTITLNIGHDLDAIKADIQNFVDTYNDVMTFVNTQFAYDTETQETGGVLFGDGTLRSVKSELTSLLTQDIWGVSSLFSTLGLVGIENTVDENNQLQLTIDDAALSGYLKTNFNDVVSLFAGQGTPSASTVAYIDHSRETQAGEYDIHIYQAAEPGSQTGSIDLSSGGADETLTITQGDNSAEIAITGAMTLNDIVNEINTELDTTHTQTIVGDQQLFADSTMSSVVSADTEWNSLYDNLGTALNFSNGDLITFSGTSHTGGDASGSYQITDIETDTVQGLLSAIENAFSSNASAAIDTSGRIVITDKYEGYSQLAISAITHPAEGDIFGAVDITSGAGDGSQTGRYAMAITAQKDGDRLVLQNDVYGGADFTISQDISDENYDHIIYSQTLNTTASSGGAVSVNSATTWSDIFEADVANSDTITISGKARNGTTDISGTYTITDIDSDTADGLLTAIENAYSDQGTTVTAFIQRGAIMIEDTTAGSSAISLTLTANNEGGGNLNLGSVEQVTQRDLDLGFINAAVSGLDVAGTIDGEPATGKGQLLRGNAGNTNTDGLTIRYSGTSADTDAGSVTITLGIAELFDRTIFNIVDSFDGYVAFKKDSLQDRIDYYDDRIEQMEEQLDQKTELMINKFVAMELALSELQNQSDWLTNQVNSLTTG